MAHTAGVTFKEFRERYSSGGPAKIRVNDKL